jgi:hypothetical protein
MPSTRSPTRPHIGSEIECFCLVFGFQLLIHIIVITRENRYCHHPRKPVGGQSSGISLGDALRLPKRHPAWRRREAQSGSGTERENLAGDAKGKGASCSNREAESTDAPERGGLPRREAPGGSRDCVQPASTLRTRLNAEAGESPTGVAHEPVGAMTEG